MRSRLVLALVVSLGVALVLSGCAKDKPAVPVAVTSLHVQASASGSASALSDAVAKIADGGTVTLAAGTYELDRLLTIDKSVQLVGAGMSKTLIVSPVKDKGVLFTGAHHFSASGITFSHEGAAPGDVVWVDAGTVHFSDCRFTGAASNRPNWFDEALWLRGTTTGVVENCTADQSDTGIGISGTATPVIQGCVCTSNSAAGVSVYGNGHPLLRHDRCSGNDGYGIEAQGRAHVTIQSCQCNAEKRGIGAADHVTGSISFCTCKGDSGVGIGFWGAARVTASDNTCDHDGRGTSGGLCVTEHAVITLSGNQCDDNASYGILFRDHSRGVARNNECSGNNYGIVINALASAKLFGNSLDSNKTQAVGRW
jgi:parallel beta-helix repeat protein